MSIQVGVITYFWSSSWIPLCDCHRHAHGTPCTPTTSITRELERVTVRPPDGSTCYITPHLPCLQIFVCGSQMMNLPCCLPRSFPSTAITGHIIGWAQLRNSRMRHWFIQPWWRSQGRCGTGSQPRPCRQTHKRHSAILHSPPHSLPYVTWSGKIRERVGMGLVFWLGAGFV
jgi:hypothetical protein